mmetsp:Transcript_13755/g.18903  ORF Transcript_13755/g.18903 Transcript_13755/m.18903 type:complete len:230 (+) Transcript_13755:1-690(+)
MFGQQSSDMWLRELEEAKKSADEAQELLHERTQAIDSGAEAVRLTGSIRRKLSGLKSKLDRLEAMLRDRRTVSEQEGERRHDMVSRLHTRCDQMHSLLNKSADKRVAFSGVGMEGPARETEQTAELDNQGLIIMQRDIMRDQDEQLDDLSRVVSSTKHISIAIGEEVDLHNTLLGELEEEMDTSAWRLKTAIRKSKELLKKSNNCKLYITIGVLVLVLVLILVLIIELS